MDNEKSAVVEVLWQERAKIVQEILDKAESVIGDWIDSAMHDSCTLDETSLREKLGEELFVELSEYMRRGIQRGVKRIYTEYNK